MPEFRITSSTVHPGSKMEEGAWHFLRARGSPARLLHKFGSAIYGFWVGEPLLADGSNLMKGPFRFKLPVWDDLQVPITQVKLAGVSDPSWTAYKGGRVLSFAKNANNIVYFTALVPHSYKQGADIEFHIHTAHPDSAAGDSIWNFTHSWANAGADFPGETTVSAVVVASPSDVDKHERHEISALTGTGKTIASMLICSLQREGTHLDDDYDDDVHLVELDFHIPRDSIGSATEDAK